jgi:DNA-binding transcriptional MerR regulator
MARANLKRLEEGKLYYSISEVCGMTGLEQHVLRYWESEFPQLRPKKNRSGNRAYRAKEIKIIRYIKYLLYDELYTIPGAKKKMADANGADLEGQLTLLRVPATPKPAPASLPEPQVAEEPEHDSVPPGENEGSAGDADGLPESAPGPEAAAEEARLRGELLRVKAELKSLLAALGNLGNGKVTSPGAENPAPETAQAGRRSP